MDINKSSAVALTPNDSGDDFTVNDLINATHELRDHALQVELDVEYFRLLNASTKSGRRAALARLKALKQERQRLGVRSW